MINTIPTTPTHPNVEDHPEPHRPAQLTVWKTKNSPTNGNMIGNPPIIFDGDRSKADQFITHLHMFNFINRTHAVITNPIQRVVLALNYIRGPKVDDWVTRQFDAISTKVSSDPNHAPTHANTDEALWEDFITEFNRAFAERPPEVLARLINLKMAGDDIEMYIATFENLMRRTEHTRESRPMVDYFHQGLPTDFQQSILERTIPDTLDEWQSAARKEVERRRIKKVYIPVPEGDTDTQQTGVIRRSRLSEEERARLRTEGRCFECNRKGHRARDCPDKLKGENVRY